MDAVTLYLFADEASRRLGVSRQTLYAYVSRGLLQAHKADDPRQSRYLAEAVDRLAAERRRGRRPKEVARSTLDWGVPVLESALTLIRDGRLYYRGHDATGLARRASLEETAALLWDVEEQDAFPGRAPILPDAYEALLPTLAGTASIGAMLPLVAVAADDDATAEWQSDPARLALGCGDLTRIVAAAAARAPGSADPIHRQLAAAWGVGNEAAEHVRAALVLCADHELNASGFTARCIASAGASLRASVLGGLAALGGVRHGAITARVETFWDTPASASPAGLRGLLQAGGDIPGFGHPLYPDGDIRAKAILDAILPDFPEAAALVSAVEDLTGRRPSIDFALVTLRRQLGLPAGAAFTIFAVGRTVGWIAHALEQRATGQLIRPRAIYTGVEPIDR
jgi:citrate synthase